MNSLARRGRKEDRVRLARLTRQYLTSFFQGRKYHLGGEIPEEVLLSPESFDFITKTEFDPGLDYCYSRITPQFNPPKKKGLEWDVKVVLHLLRDARKLNIPIACQAGIVLLYFKYCQGAKGVTRKKYEGWMFSRKLQNAL